MSTTEEPIRLDICRVCGVRTDAGLAYAIGSGAWICHGCASQITDQFSEFTARADQAKVDDALERAQPPSWVAANATSYEEWTSRKDVPGA